MELISLFKKFIKKTAGVTYLEIMIAISILGIAMTYIAYDSRFSARAVYELNEKDKMLYAAQEAMETYKLEQTWTGTEVNGYPVSVRIITDPSEDTNLENLTGCLKRVEFTVGPKQRDVNFGISSIVLISYVFSDESDAPDPPESIAATPSVDSIIINWTKSMYADSYKVKRSETSGGPYTTIASGLTNNVYTDSAVSAGTTYYYVVSAVSGGGESENSEEADAVIIIYTDWLEPTADAYIRGGSYSWLNFGEESYLYFKTHNQTRQTYKSYLKFDLSSITGTITGARLRLYGSATSASDSNVHALTDDSWVETGFFDGINWDNAPAEGTVLGNITLTRTNQYVETDVKNYCANELSGNKLASFVITSPDSTMGTVESRESVHKPQLVVTWVLQPPPAVVQNLTAVPGDRQVSLSWDTVIGASTYHVKRSTASGGPYTTINSLSATNYTDTGLTNGTTYYYVVSAENGSGEGDASNEAFATPDIVTTVTYNPEADSYIRDGSYSGTNYGTQPYLEVKNAASGSVEKRIGYYRFNLRGLIGDIISAKLRLYGNNTDDSSSAEIGCYEIADNTWQENAITFSNAPPRGAQIGSAVVNNVLTYREIDITDYVKTKMSGDKLVSAAAAGKGLEKLFSFNSRENLTNKPELVILKTLPKPEPPRSLTAVPDDSRVTLNWLASAETDSYNLKKSTTDGGPYTTIASGLTGLTYTDNAVTNGTTYYYVVTGVNASGESGNSNQASTTPNTTVTAVFNPVADARVESYYPSSNFGGSADLLKVQNDGTNNKKSYLRFDMSGYTQNTVVSARLRLYGSSTADSYKINAHKVSNNTWVETGTGGICWNNAPALENQVGTSVINTAQDYYEIDVTSYIANASDVSSLISIGLFTDVVSADSMSANNREAGSGKPELIVKMVEGAPKPPKNLTGTGGNRLANLSWSASDSAVSYRVKRSSQSGGPYTTIASGITGTTYQNTGLKNDTRYYYVVTAVNAKGESANSNEACVIPSWWSSSQMLFPTADSYVRDGGFAEGNFGDETAIEVSRSLTPNDGNNRCGYVKFDLSALGSNPSSASLEITGQSMSNKFMTIYIYKVTDDTWDEYTLDWNNQPGNDMWLGSILVRKNQNYSIDITNYVRTEFAGDKMLSLYIRASTTNRTASFSSREGSNPPLLNISY